MPTVKRTLLALPVLAALLAAGCSTSGGSEADGPSASSTTTSLVELPPPGGDEADQVVWQESTGGGFVPTQSVAAEVPAVTIYADGRIFLAEPDEQGRFDHPATVTLGEVDPDALAAFLAKAEDSGLFGDDVDFGSPGITDQASTAVTLRTGATPSTALVYALGFEDPGVDGVSDEQAARRRALVDLTADARKLADQDEAWTPDRVRATAYGPVDAFADRPFEPQIWPGPSFDEFPEPTEDGSLESCLVIEGDAATQVYEAALDNEGTDFIDDGDIRQVVVAPLLPGQEGCPPS